MPTKSEFSVLGLAHKLFLAAEAEGYTPEMLNALAENSSLLAGMRSVQLGLANIKPVLHAIDCDASPFVPDGWRVEEHIKGGIFTWDPTKVELYLSKKQKGDKRIVGNELRKELKSKPALNTNVLDYLLKPENQHLIPEEWKGKAVFFWGTIYRSSDGDLYVRYLDWNDGWWGWGYYWLDYDFNSYYPAAVLRKLALDTKLL